MNPPPDEPATPEPVPPEPAPVGAAASTAAPDVAPDADSSLETPLTAEIEAELSANTPKTRPIKRGDDPLFVPAVLPEKVAEPEVPAPVAPPVAAPPIAAPEAVPATLPEPVPAPEVAAAPEAVPATVPKAVSTLPKVVSTLPKVEFSPPAEAPHNASVTLELRSALPDASIRYALNAEAVDENGALYDPEAKIFLTQSTSVAARVFVNGQGGPVLVKRFEIAQPGWQKLEPSEPNDPTPHEMSDEATLEGPWRLAAASVRGKLHAHRGAWREDAFRHGLAHAADGTYAVILVSDGAGSAALSRVGSNLACQTALDFLLPTLTQSAPLATDPKILIERDLPSLRAVLVEGARLALQALRAEATTRARPLADFSATLLLLVRREWNGQQLCAALQAGDGGIALWNDDGTLTLLGEADHGQQSGETKFLTSSGIEGELAARVKFSIRPNLRALAVMSDGVADDFFPEPQHFPELFGAVLPLVEDKSVEAGAALLDWIDYEKKGSSDDRTLVVSWRESKGAATPGGSDGNH